ncbi:MAG: flagellar type III secretion system pore protein FliP [Planctomycetota bacterium]|jgi:flagellar biosynthetic protein FliP
MARIGLTCVCVAALLLSASWCAAQEAAAAPAAGPARTAVPSVEDVVEAINKAAPTRDDAGQANDWSVPVKLAVVFGFLALLPSLLVMMTSFTRIVIVLSFVRRALTTQNIPPTIAIVGLALFLTLFTMAPTFGRINQQCVQPYLDEEMNFADACSKGSALLKEFMVRQTRQADIGLFVELADIEQPETVGDVPTHVIVPAFAISEFRTAFEMGCLLFIPFVLVDLVIAGILLSAGMMMLPPAMISLPFKIILFILVDGWSLLTRTLVASFH